jgi:hypothetical protein
MIAEAAKGNTATGSGTVGDLLDLFLDHAASLGRSPTTLRTYKSIVETVLRPELREDQARRLSARDLDQLYAKLTAKVNKATTVRRVHALIGVALHQADDWDLVDANVSRRATPPPVHAVPCCTARAARRVRGAAPLPDSGGRHPAARLGVPR